MNALETEAFLKIARVIDPRICPADGPDAFLIGLWADMLEDVPYRGAEAALKEHYKHSTEKLMPAHIRPLMRQIKDRWERDQKRSARCIDLKSLESKQDAEEQAWLSGAEDERQRLIDAWMTPSQRRESAHQRAAETAEAVQRGRQERAQRSPEAAEAWAFYQSTVKQSPNRRKTWWEQYQEDSPLQRARAVSSGPESIGQMLRTVSDEGKRAADGAA